MNEHYPTLDRWKDYNSNDIPLPLEPDNKRDGNSHVASSPLDGATSLVGDSLVEERRTQHTHADPCRPTPTHADPADPCSLKSTQDGASLRHLVSGQDQLTKIEFAIDVTIPSGPKEYDRKLFDFAHRLKGMTDLDTSPQSLRGILAVWFERASSAIPEGIDFSICYAAFLAKWKRVKWAPGQSFQEAAEMARTRIPDELKSLNLPGKMESLASLTYYLQQQSGGCPFPLSARKAAEFLGLQKSQASDLLHALETEGLLELVSKGDNSGSDSKTASEWRFNELTA